MKTSNEQNCAETFRDQQRATPAGALSTSSQHDIMEDEDIKEHSVPFHPTAVASLTLNNSTSQVNSSSPSLPRPVAHLSTSSSSSSSSRPTALTGLPDTRFSPMSSSSTSFTASVPVVVHGTVALGPNLQVLQSPTSSRQRARRKSAAVPATQVDVTMESDSDSDDDVDAQESVRVLSSSVAHKTACGVVTMLQNQMQLMSGPYYSQILKGDLDIRPEDPSVAQKLTPDPSAFYARRLFVWLPHITWPFITLHCPYCNHHKITSKGFRKEHPYRRVYDRYGYYFLVFQRYRCTDSSCGRSFAGTNTTFLSSLPTFMQLRFPAVLTKRSGLDKTVLEEFTEMTAKHLNVALFIEHYRERYIKEYYRAKLLYYSIVKHKLMQSVFWSKDKTVERFSEYQDPYQYGGSCFSANWLQMVYIKFHQQTEKEYMDRSMQMLHGRIIALDLSHKLSALIAVDSSHPFHGVLTVANEYDQIIQQSVLFSKTHDEIEAALQRLKERYQCHGEKLDLVYTDNCCVDRALLHSVFPELTSDLPQVTYPVAGATTYPDLSLKLDPVVLCTPTDINRAINAKKDFIAHEIKTSGSCVVGLDAEWTLDKPVALIQLAFSNEEVYLFRVNKLTRLPDSLEEFLFNRNVLKAGRNVGGDISKIAAKFNWTEAQLALAQTSLIELGKKAKDLGFVTAGRASLEDLTSVCVKRCLPKPLDIRLSDWQVAALSADQIRYAALDALASQLIHAALARSALSPSTFAPGVRVELLTPAAEIVGSGTISADSKCSLSRKAGPSALVVVIDECKLKNYELPMKSSITEANRRGTPVLVSGYVHQTLVWKRAHMRVAKPVDPAATISAAEDIKSPSVFVNAPSCNFTYKEVKYTGHLIETLKSDGNCAPSIFVEHALEPSCEELRKKICSFVSLNEETVWLKLLHQEVVKGPTSDHILKDKSLKEYSECLASPDKTIHFTEFELFLTAHIYQVDIYVWCARTPHAILRILDLAENFGITAPQVEIVKKCALANVNFSDPLSPTKAMNHYRHLHSEMAPAPATVVARLKPRYTGYRVLKDAFHGLRVRLSLKHGAQLHFQQKLSHAFFIPNEQDLKEIVRVCDRKEVDVSSLSQDYLDSRVRKLIPDPDMLYNRVSATLQSFYAVKDDKTNKLLLTEDVKELCESLLEHVKKGCYSDPTGIPLYQFLYTDPDGLPVYKCARGTNNCENIHGQLISLFRGSNVGVPMVDAILRTHRYRKNIRAGIANRGDIDYGTYDHLLLHQLNELSYDIFSSHDYKKLTNPGWFKSSHEEFGFAKLPPCFDVFNPIHLSSTPSSLSSAGFLAKRLGWKSVPNDVRTHEERKLFMREFPKFKVGDKGLNSDDMALAWIKFVDGVTIFPKLPNHLDKHKTVYDKSRNRDSTMASMTDKLLDLTTMLSASLLPSHAQDEDMWLLSDPSPLKPSDVGVHSAVPFPVSPKKFFHSVEQPRPVPEMKSSSLPPALTDSTQQQCTRAGRRARRCKTCGLESCKGAQRQNRCNTPAYLHKPYANRARLDRVRMHTASVENNSTS